MKHSKMKKRRRNISNEVDMTIITESNTGNKIKNKGNYWHLSLHNKKEIATLALQTSLQNIKLFMSYCNCYKKHKFYCKFKYIIAVVVNFNIKNGHYEWDKKPVVMVQETTSYFDVYRVILYA